MGTTAQKLQNIVNAKNSISAAIEAKGGTVPTELTGYGAAIEALPSGGGSSDLVAKIADRSISGAVDLSGAAYIGNYVFQRCYNLTSVSIPDNALSIGQEAFSYTGLTSVNIPDSVTKMGTASFRNCTSMVSATIGNGLTAIPNTAFGYCSNLSNVYFKDDRQTVPSLGGGAAFQNLPADYKIWVPSALYDAWITSGNWALTSVQPHIFKYGYDPYTRVTYLDDTVSSFLIEGTLEISLIPYMNNVKSVDIGNAVFSIGNNAFSYRDNLQTVNIPYTVRTIGKEAFYGSTVSSITMENGGCITIGDYAFQGCGNLLSIELPNSTTAIGERNFFNNPLRSIKIGSGVTSLGSLTFYNCADLSSITCLAMTAPGVNATMFGYQDGNYAGRNTAALGINRLYVPTGATGYDSSYWSSILCNASKCGFTLEYI